MNKNHRETRTEQPLPNTLPSFHPPKISKGKKEERMHIKDTTICSELIT